MKDDDKEIGIAGWVLHPHDGTTCTIIFRSREEARQYIQENLVDQCNLQGIDQQHLVKLIVNGYKVMGI